MIRSYERLGIEEFGRHLLDSKDLDPTYVALAAALGGAKVPESQVRRWLVAYWCWYSAGVACWLSELQGSEFWDAMEVAARNETAPPPGGRWPRGQERRHNRGYQAINCVSSLRARYPLPEQMIDHVSFDGAGGTCKDVMRATGSHYLFGPWISFKVADMVERILRIPVSFHEAEVFMFSEPRAGAGMYWAEEYNEVGIPNLSVAQLSAVVSELREKFKTYLAPPHDDRPVDLQEIETVLCKWKSHRNGAYPLWHDTDDIRKTLGLWAPHSRFAGIFLEGMPRRPE